MSVFDHWHPVARACDLGRQPVPVRLAGRDLVLFRQNAGTPAALEDCCPHRRLRLSLGKVVGDRLRCAYHGWSFDASGAGESPGTPKLHACATSYDACEAHGLVWVRSRGSDRPLPELDVTGTCRAALVGHRIQAPLALVLDNFTEIEHTATVHALIGYPLERMNEVEIRVEATEDAVLAWNGGPTRRLPWHLALLLGIGADYRFHSDWTTRFSPVHSAVHHYWTHPRTGKEARIGWKLFHFFTPIDDDETQIWTLSYIKSRYWAPGGGVPLFRWLMRRGLIDEINEDKRMLEGLATRDVGLAGMKLSRFDRPLGLNRERIARIYRGQAEAAAARID